MPYPLTTLVHTKSVGRAQRIASIVDTPMNGHAVSGRMKGALVPLELPGWVEFNSWRTKLTPHLFEVALSPEGPGVRAVLYLDDRGRVALPRGNPYLPVFFWSTRQYPSGRTADWHQVAAPLVEEMRRRGSGNQLYLSPEVEDVRPWQWRGFFVGVRYTYYLDFPFNEAGMSRSARRMRDKAVRSGLTVERVTDVAPVLECLAETEVRQGFDHGLGQRELLEVRRLLGDEHLRMYVCFDPTGHPASAFIALHSPGAYAVGWTAGTKSARLKDGASNLVRRTAFDDLAAVGAIGIDLCGANKASIAAFKSNWGARLVTNFGVRTYSIRTGGRFLADWRKARSL